MKKSMQKSSIGQAPGPNAPPHRVTCRFRTPLLGVLAKFLRFKFLRSKFPDLEFLEFLSIICTSYSTYVLSGNGKRITE
jgi:hypothetical protein